MAIHYGWKQGSRLGKTVDVQAVGKQLERIREKHGGVTPEAVVDDARSTESPLHGAFEWRDDVAADRYRIVQAGYLIRSIVIVRDATPDGAVVEPVRAFVSVAGARGPEDDDAETVATRVYQSMGEVLAHPEMRAEMLARALDELHGVQRRYQQLTELANVWQALDQVSG